MKMNVKGIAGFAVVGIVAVSGMVLGFLNTTFHLVK